MVFVDRDEATHFTRCFEKEIERRGRTGRIPV